MADVASAESAKKAAKSGMWAAFFVAGVTTLFAVIAMASGKEAIAGINGGALLDAAVFAGIGIGIARLSRIAAVAGLVIYVAERLYMMSTNGPQGLLLSIFITLIFMNSVRGTFAYHRLSETL